jgi:RNA polymerase sigma-70 factor (ECF subfamily)
MQGLSLLAPRTAAPATPWDPPLPTSGFSPVKGARKDQANDRALAALMQAAQGGDGAAYAQLLRLVMPAVRQHVRRVRGFLGTADVEDLVQDVMLSVHAVRATYDPKRPFMPWLLAITRNRVADGARRHVRRSAHEVQVDELPVMVADEAASKDIERHGEVDALQHAIKALPNRQRTAVEMLKLREMSLKEAAAASGLSIGALKVSMHRAMASLGKTLAST